MELTATKIILVVCIEYKQLNLLLNHKLNPWLLLGTKCCNNLRSPNNACLSSWSVLSDPVLHGHCREIHAVLFHFC